MVRTGVKPSADASITQSQPLGEDILQIATDQAAGGADTKTGKEADGPSVNRDTTHEDPGVTKPETAADQGTSEAGDAALGVILPGDQPTKPDPATADDNPAMPSGAAAASAGKLSAQATSDSEAGTVEQQPSTPATRSEVAAEQSLPAGPKLGAEPEGAKSATVTEAFASETVDGVAEIKSERDVASKDAVQAESHGQQDVAVPMDEDKM